MDDEDWESVRNVFVKGFVSIFLHLGPQSG